MSVDEQQHAQVSLVEVETMGRGCGCKEYVSEGRVNMLAATVRDEDVDIHEFVRTFDWELDEGLFVAKEIARNKSKGGYNSDGVVGDDSTEDTDLFTCTQAYDWELDEAQFMSNAMNGLAMDMVHGHEGWSEEEAS
jgi:hypothetical protein